MRFPLGELAVFLVVAAAIGRASVGSRGFYGVLAYGAVTTAVLAVAYTWGGKDRRDEQPGDGMADKVYKRFGWVKLTVTPGRYESYQVREHKDGHTEYHLGDWARTRDGWVTLSTELIATVKWD